MSLCLTFSVCLSLKGFFAGKRISDLIMSRNTETVSGEWLQSCHQELGLIATRVHLLRNIIIVLSHINFITVYRIVIIIERNSPSQQDRPTTDTGDHWSVRRRLRGILNQINQICLQKWRIFWAITMVMYIQSKS